MILLDEIIRLRLLIKFRDGQSAISDHRSSPGVHCVQPLHRVYNQPLSDRQDELDVDMDDSTCNDYCVNKSFASGKVVGLLSKCMCFRD